MKKLIVLILLLSLTVSCEQESTDPVSKSDFKLDTYITLTIYENNMEALEDSFDLIDALEKDISRTTEGSSVYSLNEKKEYEVSDDVLLLINKSIHYSELSGGLFDVTIEPLVSLWNIGHDDFRVPSENEIAEVLSLISYKNITAYENIITLSNDSSIDLGAIAKGHIADRIKEKLVSSGVESGIVNLGGNVLLIGSKPDGSDFKIGIRDPRSDMGDYMGILSISDGSVVTSGVYERVSYDGDNAYHHLLNPFTGYPEENEILSVSIITEKSIDGDVLSTAVYLLGLEKGMELIESLDDTEAIFINDDNTVHMSSGVTGFEITNEIYELSID